MDNKNISAPPPAAEPKPEITGNYIPNPNPVKKRLPIVFIALGLVGVAIIAGLIIFKPKAATEPPKPKIQEAVNTVPVSDRPYVTLEPFDSGSSNPEKRDHPFGTEALLKIHTVTLGAVKAEYEVEYQSGSLLQAAFGSLDLSTDALPATRTVFFGSCSAGGKCDYNKDITGGTLLVRLSGGSQKFAVKGEWTYQLASEREGKFSSRDSKFRLDVGPKGLPGTTYVIIMQTMGLPKPVEGEIVSGPYHVSAGDASVKSAEISWRLSDDASKVKLFGWTGSAWKEYKSAIVEGVLTSTIDRLTTFVVVK